MEKIDIKIKRINSVHVNGTRFPCYFVLDENDEVYQYSPSNNRLATYLGHSDEGHAELTFTYLALAKPGDTISVEIKVVDIKEGENNVPINKIVSAAIKNSVSTD